MAPKPTLCDGCTRDLTRGASQLEFGRVRGGNICLDCACLFPQFAGVKSQERIGTEVFRLVQGIPLEILKQAIVWAREKAADGELSG